MTALSRVLRYAAFATDPAGGNPAGVVLDADDLLDDADAMASLAAAVGYSETAFCATPRDGRVRVRYFAPATEVPFCGHATIAAGVAMAERTGATDLVLDTFAGDVPVAVADVAGRLAATLTSVEPEVRSVDADVLAEALAALHWDAEDLHRDLPPASAYAGAEHLVLIAATRQRLAHLDYDVPRLTALMTRHDWTTVHLAWPESPLVHHVRNAFPIGGVYEDPATGAAAAAYGGYLRHHGAVPVPSRVTLWQGEDLGRRSELLVDLVEADPRVRVTGHAVPIA